MKSLRSSSWLMVAATVALAVGVSGFAIAASSSTPAKQVNACAKKKGGALRVAAKCTKKERRVRWATTGPRGLPGATGATGATGPAGTPGKDGPAGAAGKDGAAGANGTNGTDGLDGIDGTNGTDGTTTGETFYDEDGTGSNFGGGTCGAPLGTSVTFTAPTGSYVQVMAQADLQRASATANGACLQLDGGTAQQIMVSTSLAYETRYLQQGNAAGATDVFAARPYVFPVSAGSHTISLTFSSTGGTSNFKARKLWVTLFRPTS